ncbi:lysine N(6)-hydroxylase/L-ornithine N(5)-oxygenase family protein [Mumia quercus]|uniref:lysine N(6)-hydroxylase/L-ornithine N(5)-oxygenase family protein n=1 Tax=Mumia quercus TaxID=2976125 RepID=UPI0021CDF74F|nr:SidA/IucD/PvdA family monooxygenase [Mumia quercus]
MTYDLVGIGIGPFNLGLACLADPLDEIDAVFLDTAPEFRWHPGMMLEGSTIQVPFLADLVTMADPTSRFSFLSFLKATGRLYPFYIRESFYPLRAEYDAYCRWAADQLDALRWGRHVEAVTYDPRDDTYVVHARCADGTTETYRARHVVLGTGTRPVVPTAAHGLDGPWLHSADYLPHREALREARSITVVGSGQSAAEIYRDLLEDVHDHAYRLDWVTRSPRFFPMEYTKLTLEMTSPEYTDHFHALPLELRQLLGREQRALYKGISGDLVDDIYDTLYRKSVERPVPTTLLTDTALVGAAWTGEEYVLRLRHDQLGEEYERRTERLVLATGYAATVPAFVDPVRHLLAFDELGRFAVGRDYAVDGDRRRVFVQNGEEHTHGVTAPDLGFGPWRSSTILAAITGREVYPIERRIAFQEFGVPAGAEPVGTRTDAGVGRR